MSKETQAKANMHEVTFSQEDSDAALKWNNQGKVEDRAEDRRIDGFEGMHLYKIGGKNRPNETKPLQVYGQNGDVDCYAMDVQGKESVTDLQEQVSNLATFLQANGVTGGSTLSESSTVKLILLSLNAVFDQKVRAEARPSDPGVWAKRKLANTQLERIAALEEKTGHKFATQEEAEAFIDAMLDQAMQAQDKAKAS